MPESNGLITAEEFLKNKESVSPSNSPVGVFGRLEQAEKEKEAEYKATGDYAGKFTSDYDKIKADTDNDGKVSEAEYKNYIIHATESIKQPSELPFNLTTVISVGLICITIIISTMIVVKSRYKRDK